MGEKQGDWYLLFRRFVLEIRDVPAASNCVSPPPEGGAPNLMALITGGHVSGGGLGGRMLAVVRDRIVREEPTVSKSQPLHFTAIKPTKSKPRTIHVI